MVTRVFGILRGDSNRSSAPGTDPRRRAERATGCRESSCSPRPGRPRACAGSPQTAGQRGSARCSRPGWPCPPRDPRPARARLRTLDPASARDGIRDVAQATSVGVRNVAQRAGVRELERRGVLAEQAVRDRHGVRLAARVEDTRLPRIPRTQPGADARRRAKAGPPRAARSRPTGEVCRGRLGAPESSACS